MQRTKIGEAAEGGKGAWMDMTAFHGDKWPQWAPPLPLGQWEYSALPSHAELSQRVLLCTCEPLRLSSLTL